METTKQPRYYFDLRKERKTAAKGESAYTPAVALIAAMGAALDYLEQQGGGDLAKGRELLMANAELMRRVHAGSVPKRWGWNCSRRLAAAALRLLRRRRACSSSDW